jgi:predicted nucleotidyltransferase
VNLIDKVQERIQEHYDIVSNKGYEVVGVFLQGSQNYELSYENSDVDSKAILLPKFNDFVLNKTPISTTLVLDNNEHIDLKDIRLMFDCFKKQNINFVEILFTKYKVLNPQYKALFQPLIDNREMIARYNNYAAVNCIAGMSMEKVKALEHPYPTLLDKIEKYGYDPKQLHHIVRLREFIERYINGEPYSECLISKQKEYLIEVKKGTHTLEEARSISNTLDKETCDIKKRYMENNALKINSECETILNDALISLIRYSFQKELKEDYGT